MQGAVVGGWGREPQWSGAQLSSLYELNLRFLQLIAAGSSRGAGPAWVGVAQELAERLVPLSVAQRAAAARCPYALFDLRFHDDAYWQLRVQNPGGWSVAEEPGIETRRAAATDATAPVATPALNFVQAALFYAWYVAATGNSAAHVLLGMSDSTVQVFRVLTVDRLPHLAETEACHLTARWSGSRSYWSALTHAAERADPAALRRVQLSGLQLAAASRLYAG